MLGRETHESQQEEHSKLLGIKSKTVTKLFGRVMNRRVDMWNNKEVNTTPTVPCTIRTAIGRKI